jgi:hypothetical protein
MDECPARQAQYLAADTQDSTSKSEPIFKGDCHGSEIIGIIDALSRCGRFCGGGFRSGSP